MPTSSTFDLIRRFQAAPRLGIIRYRIVPLTFRGTDRPYFELQARTGRGPWFHVRDCNTRPEAEAEIARREPRP